MSSETITSGASPVNCDLAFDLTHVITGGTHGQEIINLPNFTLDANGVNVEKIGATHVIHTQTMTANDDVPAVTVNGGDVIFCVDWAGIRFARPDQTDQTHVPIDQAGYFAVFRWTGTFWAWDNSANNSDASLFFDLMRVVPPVRLRGVNANTSFDLNFEQMIAGIVLFETSGQAVTINIGTSAGGNDVVNAKSVPGNFYGHLFDTEILKRTFQNTIQTLYVSSANWNGAGLIIDVQTMQKNV